MKKLAILLFLFAILPQAAAAQLTNNAAHGLGISPFLFDLEIPKGGTDSQEVELTNTGNDPITVIAEPRDFLPGKDGQPEFVPDPEINDKTFSLASWIHFEADNRIVIAPNETVKVTFTIAPPASAEEGTHYGAVLFNFFPSGGSGNGTEVTQAVGTIILVRYGQARETGATELHASKNLFFTSDRVVLTNIFSNSGNVHVKPKGEIYIKDWFGRTVATPFVNRDAANVLPKTQRGFVNSWTPSNFAFGKYTLESVLAYGNASLEARDKLIIWILPWYLLLILGTILAFLLWVVFHGRHLYKRRVIKKHLDKASN